jgi:hypothetical protein
MKKTFKLHIEGKNDDRVLEAIKHEVRKYVKRERRKTLPAGVDYWRFDCKFGASADVAEEIRLADLTKAIDALVAAGEVDSFFVEILDAHGVRKPREEQDEDYDDEEDDLNE